MIVETEIRRLKQEMREGFAELRKLICGRNIVGNWVMQPMACAMLNVKPRRLREIRIHMGKDGKLCGVIRWRKGKGKSVQYHKSDIEKYLNEISVS
jgi:hypothetical protein